MSFYVVRIKNVRLPSGNAKLVTKHSPPGAKPPPTR